MGNLNEPWSFTYLGYGVGSRSVAEAVDVEGDSSTEPYVRYGPYSFATVVDLYRAIIRESRGQNRYRNQSRFRWE